MQIGPRQYTGTIAALAITLSVCLLPDAAAQDTGSTSDDVSAAPVEPDATEEEFVIIDGVEIPLDVFLGEIEDIAPEAAGVAEAIWLRMPIAVCWESMIPEHADGRAWTQDAVENSWAKVADISFEGWGECNPSSRGIRIDVAEAGPNVAELGKGLDGLQNGMTLNFKFTNWGVGCADHLEYCIRALAVHEFGHAIGLAHEHNRDDRDLCAAEMQGPRPTFTVTAYDPTSVMNYCASEWNNRGQLSPLDVAGVRMIYGPFTDETPATGNISIKMDFHGTEGDRQVYDIEHDFKVISSQPSAAQVFWQCNNTDRALKIDIQTALIPGKPAISVNMKATLFKSVDCAQDGPIIGSRDYAFSLDEPFSDGGKAASVGLGGVYSTHSFDAADERMGDTEITMLAYRSIGDETVSQSCQDCAAAAAEAIFAPDEIRPGAQAIGSAP